MPNCVDEVSKLLDASTGMTKDDLTDLFNEAKTRMEQVRAANEVPVSQAMADWLETKRGEFKTNALLQQRNAAFNALTRVDMINVVTERFGTGKEMAKGFNSLVAGDSFKSQISAASAQKSYANKWTNSLVGALEARSEAHLKIYTSGRADADVADAMFLMKKGELKDVEAARLKDMDPIIKEVAEDVNRVVEDMRLEMNQAGAFIGKRDDYIWKQSHSQRKIKKGGYDTWWKSMDENIDYLETFGFTRREMNESPDAQKLVHDVSHRWFKDFASGIHMKSQQIGKISGVGTGNVAKKLSQSRSIHFKDGQHFHAYQKDFGIGSMSEAINVQIMSSARSMGLMRKLGPNFKENLDSVLNDLKAIAEKNDDREAFDALSSASVRNKVERDLGIVDGSALIPANNMVSSIGSALRFIQTTSKLGSSVISALTDPVQMMANARSQGRGFFSGVSEAMDGLFSTGVPRNVKREIARSVGIGFDVTRASMADMFHTVDAGPGMISKGTNLFFKMNGVSSWTDSMRLGQITAEATWLAELSGKSFDDLDIRMQRALEIGNIGRDEWDVIRLAKDEIEWDGGKTGIITPEKIADLDDSIIASLLEKRGENVSKNSIGRMRTKLDENLRGYYQDLIDSTVIEPTARTQSAIRQGAKKGTLLGEIWMSMMQFKSFPLAMMNQRVLRDIQLQTGKRGFFQTENFGLNADNLAAMPAMAQFMAATAVFGFAAMSLKDIVKGRKPRDPLDFKTAQAAMLQGGGLGIYGDFLFGESKNRFGGGPVMTLLGPTAGMLNSTADLYGRMKNGDDVGSSALKLLYNNTPGLNMFYIKPVTDYLIMERVFNELNPGQSQRRARRLKKENDQTLLWQQTKGL